MSDPTKVHVHTPTDGPCGHCSGSAACPMRYCPGCPPGCALAEDEPGEDHSDVRSVSPAGGPECPESVAQDGLGATQSPDGSPSATHGLRGPESAVTDAEAAQWAALADAATEGPFQDRLRGERDRLSGLLAESERDLSRALDERDAARAELDKYLVLAPQTCPLGEHAEWLVDSEHLHPCPWCERDRARGTAAALEAENARLREGIEALASDLDNHLRERHSAAPQDMFEVAEDLRALLADTDSAQAEGGE